VLIDLAEHRRAKLAQLRSRKRIIDQELAKLQKAWAQETKKLHKQIDVLPR
jgi:hypothetical protein